MKSTMKIYNPLFLVTILIPIMKKMLLLSPQVLLGLNLVIDSLLNTVMSVPGSQAARPYAFFVHKI